jgi:Ca2+ transporting ATPase
LAEDIGKLGMLVALITFVALMIHLVINCFTEHIEVLVAVQAVVQAFMIGVTIVVVAVPEVSAIINYRDFPLQSRLP